MVAYRMFGLGREGDLFCSSNRMLNYGRSPRYSTDLFIFLCRVNAVFCLTPTFWGQGYFKQLEIKCRWFQYSLECPPDNILCFSVLSFSHIFIFFTNISKFPCPYPGKWYFCQGWFPTYGTPVWGWPVSPEMHRSVARLTREYVKDPTRKLQHRWRSE